MIDVVDGLDLSGVPIPFLEAYPYPAFVLAIPAAPQVKRPPLISRDTDVTVRHYDDVSPLAGPPLRTVSSVTIAWSNEKWSQVTQGRRLEDVLNGRTQSQLVDWIEGDDDLYQAVFVLQLSEPELTLHLSKTILPLTPPSPTHAFCVITSQSRTQTVAPDLTEGPSPGLRSSVSTDVRSNFSGTTRTSLGPRASGSTDMGSTGSRPGSSSADSYFPSQDRRGRLRPRSDREKAPSIQHMISIAEEFWALFDSFDWASTKLGPKERWVDMLGPLISVTFQSKTCDCIWLGEDLHQIYNKQYGEWVDHPKAFGRPGKDNWAMSWDYIEQQARTVLNGTPIFKEDDMVMYKEYAPGFKSESYFTWRFVPINARDGTVIGFYNQAVETTDKYLAERRLATIRDLSEQILVARSVSQYYDAIADVFEQNAIDAPFILAYSVKATASDSTTTTVAVDLQRSVGVPTDHPSATPHYTFQMTNRLRSSLGPAADRLSSPTLSAISALSSGSGRHYHSASGTSWPIQKALSSRQCIIVEDCSQLIDGYPIRQWEQLPFAAVVMPICSDTSSDLPESVIIIGLNVRRPLDAEYDAWIHVIRSQLASGLVSVKTVEAEQARIEDAMRMEKAKTAWFRGAAHDLRSPLTLVRGPIEDVLNGSHLTSAQKGSLTTAKRNVDRLLRLVTALLDFSRLEAGRVQGKFVPISLGEWVSELAELFRPAIERMGVEYQVIIEPFDTLVYVDPTLFETVVSNLIGNALKYTEQGKIAVQVTFDNFAEISVSDTGVGIPKDEVEHVTEWFHRATTAIHSGTQGSGLGLALAKELLKLHDGELLVTSRTAAETGEQHGSTFTARIPLVTRTSSAPDAKDAFGQYGRAVANEAMRWTPAGAEGSNGSDLGACESHAGSGSKFSEALLFEPDDSILIVDDTVDMREYIRNLFAKYCKVIEASNGLEALEMATLHKPNLILTDYMMAKMNGLELLAAIREQPETKIIPVVLLTAMASDEARVEALLQGAEDYLEKPFRTQELLARVHLHMQVGKKRAKLETAFHIRETEIALLSDHCPSGIMRADAAGAITYANAAWRQMAGISDEVPANDWPNYVDVPTREYLSERWRLYLAGNERDLRISWKWNTGITTSGLFIRLDKVSDSMSGILGCLTDISYEDQRIADAEERRREAEESKMQQELLIDLTSHEIRTPVSAILQCSSLVKENLVALKEQLRWSGTTGFKPTHELLQDLDEDVEALESIYQCGLVQERIAGDVLSLARIQLDMLTLYDIEMDLKKEARKVLSVFASEAKMKKIELVLKFGHSMEQAKVSGIKTDPVRVGQVVTNLISNAIRFTASSDTRVITTTYDISFMPPADDTCALPSNIGLPSSLPAAEDTPMWLFVSVRDTGPGLGPKELAMLFKRFSQGNKMIHTRYGGSGLGLFICRKITELLEGRIEVQSQLGEGSTFRFFIRTRAIAPPSPLAAMVDATSSFGISSPGSGILTPGSSMSTPSITPSEAEFDWSQHHILIVEDNLINQKVLKRQLVKAGLTCDTADNGLEALNLIREADRQSKRGGLKRQRAYSTVLMDLEMPVMDGLTAVREIRTAESAGTMGRQMVIALTGNARQGQIDHALEAGMDDVVIKPYVLKNLLEKIRAMSRKREMEQAKEYFP